MTNQIQSKFVVHKNAQLHSFSTDQDIIFPRSLTVEYEGEQRTLPWLNEEYHSLISQHNKRFDIDKIVSVAVYQRQQELQAKAENLGCGVGGSIGAIVGGIIEYIFHIPSISVLTGFCGAALAAVAIDQAVETFYISRIRA